MLKNGVQVLTQHNNKFDRLSNVAEMVNSTEDHANYLEEQAAVVEKYVRELSRPLQHVDTV